MLDNLLTSLTRLVAHRLKRPALVFCFTAETDGSFTTRFDVSKGVTMNHVQGAATDLLRVLAQDQDPETTCPCCIARRFKVQTALAALTGEPTAPAPAVH